MTKLRILHCIRSLDPAGGGPADFVRMVAEFQERFPINVEAVSLDPPESPWIAAFPARVHALGPVRGTFGYSAKLDNWLKENLNSYDVAVVNGVWTYMSNAVRKASKICGSPYVLFTHGMLDPWFAKYKLKHLRKCVYWSLFEHKVLKDAQAVFFTSEHERTGARIAFSPYAAKEIVTPYGTVDPQLDLVSIEQQMRAQFPELAGRRYLLFLSRLHEKKGVDLLIRAFDRICADTDAVDLVLAGPVAETFQNPLKCLLDQLSPAVRGRIILPGMIPKERKWPLLANADALVLPSHQENFARVVSEALSCHTPVLISNKVNIWETIRDHDAGVVDEDDLEGTHRMLRTWLALSAEQRTRHREFARNCYDKNFDAVKNFSVYLESLRNLISQPVSHH